MPIGITPDQGKNPNSKSWWSQAGSNRRPPHCERGALPAELWPLKDAQRRENTQLRGSPVSGRHLRPGGRGVKAQLVPGRLCRYIFRDLETVILMRALFLVIDLALQLYIWILIAAAVLSWLVAFNVVNSRNQVVVHIGEFLYRITEPLLRPIRNAMPNLGGIDVSPVVLILIIIFIRYVIALYILPNVF